MKIKGQEILKPIGEDFHFYRPDGKGEIVEHTIHVSAVLDMDEIEKKVKKPEPFKKQLTNPPRIVQDTDHPKYKEKMAQYFEILNAAFYLEALRDSGIEWATINEDEPETWLNYLVELRTVLLPGEVSALVNVITRVNNPTKESMERAFKAFTQDTSEKQLSEELSLEDDLDSTKSIEPVKG